MDGGSGRFGSEIDWFDHRLENDPQFLKPIEKAQTALRTGNGVRREDVGSTSADEAEPPLRGRLARPFVQRSGAEQNAAV
jgi:hypothetical protein